MRSLLLFLCIIFIIPFSTIAQVLNTGNVLQTGKFCIGFAPFFLVRGDTRLGLHTSFGYGIKRDLDLGLMLNIAQNRSPLFGLDLEFLIVPSAPAISLATGAHVTSGSIGLDGTFNLSGRLQRSVWLYGGLNTDIDFYHDVSFGLWTFLGIEVPVRSKVHFQIEVDFDMLDTRYHIFGAGFLIFL